MYVPKYINIIRKQEKQISVNISNGLNIPKMLKKSP